MTTTIINQATTIQFGNLSDSHGYRVVNGTVVAQQQRFMSVYLVKEGNTFGVATLNRHREDSDAEYYCTNALTVGRVFMGNSFTVEDVAKHLGFPVEVIEQAMAA